MNSKTKFEFRDKSWTFVGIYNLIVFREDGVVGGLSVKALREEEAWDNARCFIENKPFIVCFGSLA